MRIQIIFLSLLFSTGCFAQGLSLADAIHTARTQSVEALETRQSFISTYWAYRSYQASRLPSVILNGGLMRTEAFNM